MLAAMPAPVSCHRAMLDAIRYLVDNGIKWRAMPADFPPLGPGLRVLPPLARPRPDHGVPRPAAWAGPRARGPGRASRRPGSSTRSRCKAAAVVRPPTAAASTAARRSTAASGTSWSTRSACCWPSWSPPRTSATATPRRSCCPSCADAHRRLALVWADGGYTGSLVGLLPGRHSPSSWRSSSAATTRKGFVVLPKRWVVERTFAWLMRTRRLARDYERRTTSAEAMVHWSMTTAHDPPPGPATPAAEREPARRRLGQPAPRDQAFRLRPQRLHLAPAPRPCRTPRPSPGRSAALDGAGTGPRAACTMRW